MYIPKIYRSEDAELMKKIISQNAFALLISDKEKISATHSMFLLNETEDDFYMETHISKANFQAKVLKDGDEVLCDFLGAILIFRHLGTKKPTFQPGITKPYKFVGK